MQLKYRSDQNAFYLQEAASSQLGDGLLEVYNTRARVEQSATTNDEDVLEIDGVILDGMEKSVGSTLKSEAIKLAKAAGTFSNLSEEAKDTVYLGLNSIIDLSNNRNAPDSQRSLFPGSSWQQLKSLVYESREMPSLPYDVTEELKDIEKVRMYTIANLDYY